MARIDSQSLLHIGLRQDIFFLKLHLKTDAGISKRWPETRKPPLLQHEVLLFNLIYFLSKPTLPVVAFLNIKNASRLDNTKNSS
jgi:hypothetical protein